MIKRNVLIGGLASLILVAASCSQRGTDCPDNTPPAIKTTGSLHALEGRDFIFRPQFSDPDGPDTVIEFIEFPAWLEETSGILHGIPEEFTDRAILTFAVSDGQAADTQSLTIMVTHLNRPPLINCTNVTEATGGIDYSYRVTFEDRDGPDTLVEYINVPEWLTPDGDSLFGIPPDGISDSCFLVAVSDGLEADTQMVWIDMIPSIAVYGDSRTGHTQHQQIVDLIRATEPIAVFHTGDLVNNGLLQSDWDAFFDITADMLAESEFFPAMGNHEFQSPIYFSSFELPNNEQWYSVIRNNIQFIILNSCVASDSGSEQYLWLENELTGIDDSIDFVVAVFHHPPYSTGIHAEDEMNLRESWVPLFEQYDVDIIFNGHDHDYERSFCGGRYYIVAGGGGAPLRDQARTHPCSQLFIKTYHFCKLSKVDDRLIVKVFDINALLIDQFELSAR